jgi:hypothetical protein
MNINRVLGYLAAASAAIAFLLWALPYGCYQGYEQYCGFGEYWFTLTTSSGLWSGEAQWVLVFAVASIFLLIARAGNRR